MKIDLFRISIALFALFTLAHILTVPVAISYDGFQYIDLAGVLFSSRFPHDWMYSRTPLYPLCLKASFGIFGQQPLAIILTATLAGTATTRSTR